MLDNVVWCLKRKEFKFIKPNQDISRSFMDYAVNTILKAEKLYKEQDYLWSSIMAYYAEYYAIIAFLYAIGIKIRKSFLFDIFIFVFIGYKNKSSET